MASGPTTSSITASRYALAGQYNPTPDTVSADAFKQWPAGVQAAFVQSFASGNSASILVGLPGAQVIATLTPGGGDVEVTQAPLAINQLPSELNVYEFQSWPSEAQILYTQTNGSGSPASVDIGTTGATLTATLTVDAGGAAVGVGLTSSAGLTSRYGITLDKAPADLSAVEFFSLLPDEQYAYALRNSTQSPPSIALGNPGANAMPITLLSNGRPYTVSVAPDTYPGFANKLAAQNSLVQNFGAWPREVQRAYVDAQSSGPVDAYPKTVVLGASNAIASIAAKGAEVDIVPIPNGFQSGALPTAGIFLSWPEAAQIAFARTRLQDPAAPPLAFTSASGQVLNVTLDDGPSGIRLASPVDTAVAPANLDLNLFQLWPVADQALYLQARGSGTPKTLVIGNDTALITTGANGRAEIDPFPTGFATPLASLSPALYLTWSPAFRALYTARNGTLDPATGTKTATIGATGQQITTSVSSGGALSVSNDILRIDPSKSLEFGLAIPTANIYGSSVGLDPNPNRASAENLFPTLTGATGQTEAGAVYVIPDEDKPPLVLAQFNKGPSVLTPAEFGQWNSAIQLEYLRKYGDASKGFSLTIGPSGNQSTSFIGSSGSKVFTVEGLQKTDIGKMNTVDQQVLSGLKAFYDPDAVNAQGVKTPTGVAIALGLLPGRANAQAIVGSVVNAIQSPSDDPTSPNYLKGGDSHMPDADKKLFLDELAIITTKINAGTIFSANDIKAQTDEIKARFERMNCFAVNLYKPGSRDPESVILDYATTTVQTYVSNGSGGSTLGSVPFNTLPGYQNASVIPDAPVTVGGAPTTLNALIKLPDQPFTGPFTYVFPNPAPIVNGQQIYAITVQVSAQSHPVGVDQNAGIKAAYDTFKAQESQLLNLATNRMNLAFGNGPANTQNLDVPNLVYLFQLYSNLAGEAKIRADTEEINQTNAFLKVYSVVQNLINSTVKSFDPKSTDPGPLKGSLSGGGLTPEEEAAVAMFKSGRPLSPIEALKGIPRPTDDFSDRKMSQWQTYGQQLSDKVTLINQESQIRMNDINSQTKAKDRNFDLANNSLSKINEIVQKIASAA